MTDQSAEKPEDRIYASMRQMYDEWANREPAVPNDPRPHYNKLDSDTPLNLGMFLAVLCVIAGFIFCGVFIVKDQPWLAPVALFGGVVCGIVTILLTRLFVDRLERINASRKKTAYAGTGWMEYEASRRVWEREADQFRLLAIKDSAVRNKLSSAGYYVHGY